jgi:anti-sigma regulatory factor (Ser/Thr protein kinase)
MRPDEDQGYRHSALLFDSDNELVAAALPYLTEGLAAGESALLTCRAERNAALTEALGDDERVVAIPRESVYPEAVQSVTAYRRIVLDQLARGSGRVRVIGEVPFGTEPELWNAWIRFEGICNVALAPLALSTVCAYDTRDLPDPVRDGVVRTHPRLLGRDGHHDNDGYVDLTTTHSGSEPGPAGPPALHIPRVTYGEQLTEVRRGVLEALHRAAYGARTCGDFPVAVGEVVTNALVHGRPPVDVRLWLEPARVVCVVSDGGPGFDDPLAGYLPPEHPTSAAGLWLARQMCDTLSTARTGDRFAVHLAARNTSPG